MKNLYYKISDLLATIGNSLTSPFLLIVRLYWGWHFCATGWGKLHRLDEITRWFGSELHIPAPRLNAIMASSTECFGGFLLMLGLCSRLISVPLAVTMVVAYATTEHAALKALFQDPDKFVTAAPFLFLFAVVIIFVFGPGKYSLDAYLCGGRTGKDRRGR